MKSVWAGLRTRSGAPSGNEAGRLCPGEGGYGMVAALTALLLFGLGSGPAQAQSSQGLFWNCATNGGQSQYCPVNNQYPLPNGPAINGLIPVAGTQRGLAIASSTALTVPTGATVGLIQAQGTNTTARVCLFWQDDGTAPTATAGQSLGANGSIWVSSNSLSAIRLIASASATCTATISYYK